MGLTRLGMDGQWALKPGLGPLRPVMNDELDPLRFTIGPVQFLNGPSQVLSHSLGP